MLMIEDGFIYLTRGDTAYLNVNIVNNDGEQYVLKADDVLTLTIKKKIDDEEPAVQILANSNGRFTIMPAHTKHLEYGRYLYDVQLSTSVGEIFTVVPKSNFYITEEVTT